MGRKDRDCRKMAIHPKNAGGDQKELKAVRWAVASMSGLAPTYGTAAARNNIDDDDWIEITGRDAKKTHKVIVAFGSYIDEKNYADAPPALKTVACTIQIIGNRARTRPNRTSAGAGNITSDTSEESVAAAKQKRIRRTLFSRRIRFYTFSALN
jgi:hypothetical protein